MRLSIDGGGYAAAATAFADANHTAALLHDSLCGKLGGYAAMAGDDTAAAEFATAYDAAATDAVHALADLVTALASLGRLTEQSLANHEEANLRSVIPGAVVYQGTDLPDAGYVSVLATTPPSSLGGDAPHLSEAENWILDHLGAVVWPNADTDRLHDAAHAWRSYAESVDRLADHCDIALANLQRQRSPEIPLAVAATTDLRTTIRDLADQYAAIAGACDSYADHVTRKREELKALLREILDMVVEGVVISAAIGLISAGIGTLGGGSALAARIATQSPRFAAILTTLRTLTTTTTAHLRATQQTIHGVRARLDKFLRMPARTDAGQLGRAQALAAARAHRTIRDPRLFDPDDLRGMTPGQVRALVEDWVVLPSRSGGGVRLRDPLHRGRQIRIMPGYPGNRPDTLTHGPYVLVSQNARKYKIPLEGNSSP